MRLRAVLGPLSLLVVAAGCQNESPIDPDQMAAQAADEGLSVLHAAALAADGNPGAQRAATRVTDGVTVMSRAMNQVPLQPTRAQQPPRPAPYIPQPRQPSPLAHLLLTVPAVRGMVGPLFIESLLGPTPPPGAVFATAGASSELASDLEDVGDNLRRLLRERVLVKANLERRADGEAVYLLKPDPTCRDLDSGEIDKSCQDMFTKVEVRVRLTRESGGARLQVTVGRAEPGTLAISPGQIALTLSLEGIKSASAVISQAQNEKDDTPAVMKGSLRFVLKKEAARKASFAAAITQTIDVEDHGTDPADDVHVRLAPADVFNLTADGDGGTITAGIGFKTMEVFAAWQPEGSMAPNGQMHVTLGGLSGQATFTQASDDVKLAKLGLGAGPSSLEVRGQRILQVDLNEHDGRLFDTTFTFDAAGLPRLTIKPRFDLALAFKLAAVASDFKTAPAAHLLDETYRMTLDPGSDPAALEPYDSATDDGIRVVSGKLTLASSKAGMPVVVSAGECLVAAAAQPGQHPVLGSLKVVKCP